jgi:hypothetical protein
MSHSPAMVLKRLEGLDIANTSNRFLAKTIFGNALNLDSQLLSGSSLRNGLHMIRQGSAHLKLGSSLGNLNSRGLTRRGLKTFCSLQQRPPRMMQLPGHQADALRVRHPCKIASKNSEQTTLAIFGADTGYYYQRLHKFQVNADLNYFLVCCV